MHFSASIVIPVWNRLDALGSCLANLAEHTPDAQFILVDLGSERETEQVLEHFAEVLEEQVLLMREPLNQGKIAAINRGIASAAAECIVILSPQTMVTSGWLAPLRQLLDYDPHVGIVCPVLHAAAARTKGGQRSGGIIEIDRGSFSCQAISRQLIEKIGLFDSSLECSEWCLADFSRRSWRAGYKTVRCLDSNVYTSPEQLFGSTERRARIVEQSRQLYVERWGESVSYCVCLEDITGFWPTLLGGARQGDTFEVIIQAAIAKEIRHEELLPQHENIEVHILPRLFTQRRTAQLIARASIAKPHLTAVTEGTSVPLPTGLPVISQTELLKRIAERERTHYGREPRKDEM